MDGAGSWLFLAYGFIVMMEAVLDADHLSAVQVLITVLFGFGLMMLGVFLVA